MNGVVTARPGRRALVTAGAALVFTAAWQGAGDARGAPPAQVASAHGWLEGSWTNRNKRFQRDGLTVFLSANFTTTPWAPLSAGRPEDVVFRSYEVQDAEAVKRIISDNDAFAEGARNRPKPAYTAEGRKAAEALAAPSGRQRTPYDQCLPQNSLGVFGPEMGFSPAATLSLW